MPQDRRPRTTITRPRSPKRWGRGLVPGGPRWEERRRLRGPPRQEAAGRSAGFTLLELMVAFALVALMVVLLGAGVRFGARVWEGSHAQVEAAGDVFVVRRFLRERVLAAKPVGLGEDGGDEAVLDFEGEAGSLRLATLMPSYAAPGGLYHAEFMETSGPEGSRLVLTWWPFDAEGAGGEAAQRRVLLEGIAGLRIGYFGDPENRDAPAWHEAWPRGPALPRLLSIEVVFPPGDPRTWPELIVPVPASEVAPSPEDRRG